MAALSAEKAIELAATKWAEEAKDAVRTGKRVRLQLDAIIENHIVQYIDFPKTPRLVTMAG